ncbi:MAG: hypothetical protein K0R27_4552 [Xanthobacteraceae bacterium]|jgi:hypothetical protein|nr:hypothetical protein [Xanthobacteraceae bacterium]
MVVSLLLFAGRQGGRPEAEDQAGHIDVTEVDGGCWVYGGHHWLERTLKDLGLAQR